MSGGRNEPRATRGTGRDRPAPRRADGSLPIRDLGPLGPDPGRPGRLAGDRAASQVLEAIELAAVEAERGVRPFLIGAAVPRVRGRAAVGLRFLDDPTFSSFLRCGALTGRTAFETRLMVRRWASAEGDALLDERMAYVVANRLEAEFRGLLQAIVFSVQEGRRST